MTRNLKQRLEMWKLRKKIQKENMIYKNKSCFREVIKKENLYTH